MLFRSDRKSTRLNSSHTIISYALPIRSEEHTSELQSHDNLVCRLLLEKKHRSSTTEPRVPRTPKKREERADVPRDKTANLPPQVFFFFNNPAPPEIYPLSLPDALPISQLPQLPSPEQVREAIDASLAAHRQIGDRKSTRLNSSHTIISYAVFCLKK